MRLSNFALKSFSNIQISNLLNNWTTNIYIYLIRLLTQRSIFISIFELLYFFSNCSLSSSEISNWFSFFWVLRFLRRRQCAFSLLYFLKFFVYNSCFFFCLIFIYMRASFFLLSALYSRLQAALSNVLQAAESKSLSLAAISCKLYITA